MMALTCSHASRYAPAAEGSGTRHARSSRIMVPLKLVPRGVRPTAAEDQARKVLSTTVAPEAEHIARIMVQFVDDADGEGIICSAKVTLAKALHVPSFHLEGHAETTREAVDLVGD